MSISNLSINRPVTILMIVLAIVFVGLIALNALNVALFPDVDFPIAFVQVSYPGVDPAEMENIVTRPLEDEIATVSNLDEMTSYSVEGFSQIVVQFEWGSDIDVGAADLREKVDIARKRLPRDIEQIIVQKVNMDSMPVMTLAVAGGDDPVSLRSFVDDDVRHYIESSYGVANVNLSGGLEREIQIDVDLFKLTEYNLSINDINQALSSDNMNLPVGDVEEGQFKYLVRAESEVESVKELEEITVTQIGNSIIKLGDVASVNDTHADIDSFSRFNLSDSVNISIQAETGANPVNISDEIHKLVQTLRDRFPEYQFEVGQDNSEFIRDSINMVSTNALAGAILASIVLFLFLKNLRSTIIIAIAIPISIVATFSMIYLREGMTLNLMTLGGLALGIGMILDNSVVVLENVYRHFFDNNDKSKKENASIGANEVALPVLASTLTTIAVFAPLGFVPGIVGEIFLNMALTIVFSLVSSYFAAFTVIPALASKILQVNRNKKDDGFIFRYVKKYYSILLSYIISSKLRLSFYFFAIIILFFLSLTMFPPTEFFPDLDQGEFEIGLEFASGTKIKDVDKTVTRYENILLNREEVEKVITNVNLGEATLRVTLIPVEERDITVNEMMNYMRTETAHLPNILYANYSEPEMGPPTGGKPIQIDVYGQEYEKIEHYCQEIGEILSKIEGIEDLDDGVKRGRPEVRLRFDRDKIQDLGLSFGEVSSALRTYVFGNIAGKYKEDNLEYDIRVKLEDYFVDSISKIQNLRMYLKGKTVVLSEVAEVELDYGYTTIQREDKRRVLSVGADIYGRPMGMIVADIQEALSDYQMQEGYEFKLGGDEEERQEAFGDLFLALIAAIVLVYMIMASQFESLAEPFIIMFTIPLSVIGVVLALKVSGFSFSVTAIIGLIMLAGIVVNNGILLIDYINNQRRRENKNLYDAVMIAGKIRIRPIIMTTMTTILGMSPLALGIGAGADFFQPLAITVIGGLFFSSFFTLTFIPVTYVLFDLSKGFIIKLIKN
ncbi:MAG: efflux RND transporter permease subunit [Candidatus Muiribacteriota bacterium]